MKTTNVLLVRPFATQSLRLCVITIITVIGLTMTACPEPEAEPKTNPPALTEAVAGIGFGDPSIKLYLNGNPLTNGGTTSLNQSGTYTVSIASGTYTDIVWYLNDIVAAQGSSRTSIALLNKTPGKYQVTVEAVPSDGVKNSGSHTFVVQ